MNCHLIFYLSSKTNQCEKTLKKCICDLKLSLNNISFATNSLMLGEKLIQSLHSTNLVFIVGGLFTAESTSVTNVLSKVLSVNKPDEVYKLKCSLNEHHGYLIKKGSQIIVVLPDSPQEIECIFDDVCKNYIKKTIF